MSAPGRAGDGLHDPPSAVELLAAVRELLEHDVLEATEGRVRFHVRVACNVLGMVERELAEDPGRVAELTGRLATLTGSDGPVRERLVALAEGIRARRFRWDDPAVTGLVRDLVAAKLAVSDPGYARGIDAPPEEEPEA